jgi:hypothetical protein
MWRHPAQETLERTAEISDAGGKPMAILMARAVGPFVAGIPWESEAAKPRKFEITG